MTAARSAGATHRAVSASGWPARFPGVSMTLGRTQLTVTPSCLTSCEAACTRAMSAALPAAYALAPANGATAARLETATTRPPPPAHHPGQERAHHDGGARGVEIELALPLVAGHLPQRSVTEVSTDQVHERPTSGPAVELGGEGAGLVGIGDIEPAQLDPVAQSALRPLCLVVDNPRDDGAVPGVDHRLAHSQSEPARTAGDDHGPSVFVAHRALL